MESLPKSGQLPSSSSSPLFLLSSSSSKTAPPPMLLPLIPSLKIQLRLCNLLATIPFEWDEALGVLRLLSSKRQTLLLKAQMAVHVMYMGLMTLYFLLPWGTNNQKLPNSSKMVGYAFLVCFGATMLMRLGFWKRRREVVHLVNNYLLFENKYFTSAAPSEKGQPQQKPKADRVTRSLMILGYMTSAGLPGFMGCILLGSPCKPPHLGYIFFGREGGGCEIPGWPTRIFILAFDTWMWANSIPPAVFFAFQVFLPGIRCLGYYLQLLISVFGGSEKESSSRSSHRLRHCFRVYNNLRLLGNLYNFCLAGVFIPTQIVAACMVIIIGLFTCIKLHSEVPMPGFAFFPLLSLDGFAMIFISNVAANVYLKSRAFVVGARSARDVGRKSWFRKLARSTDLIKIMFGSSNYIDQMTPIVYINFCFTQTVSLVLLS